MNTDFQTTPVDIEDGFVHYEVHTSDAQLKQRISDALFQFNRIESYRMLEERRKILMGDGISWVLLYSGSELTEKTGRSIRPQNIRPGEKYPNVIFHLTPQGTIKEEVID